MSKDNVEIVESGYEAFARQDIPAVLERFSAEIVWEVPETLSEDGPARGHDGVVEFFGSLPARYAELSVEPEEWIDGGQTVVALGHHRGSGHNGVAFEVAFAHVWELSDGLVVRFREFADTAALLPAIAEPEA